MFLYWELEAPSNPINWTGRRIARSQFHNCTLQSAIFGFLPSKNTYIYIYIYLVTEAGLSSRRLGFAFPAPHPLPCDKQLQLNKGTNYTIVLFCFETHMCDGTFPWVVDDGNEQWTRQALRPHKEKEKESANIIGWWWGRVRACGVRNAHVKWVKG